MSRGRALVALGAAATTAAVTFALGQWQLRRAVDKLALEARWTRAEQAGAQPADATVLERLAPADLPQRVRVRGQFDARYSVWLDNRQQAGRPGFWVVTPLRLADGSAVLVNRGWVARDPRERTRLPALPTPAHEVEIEALAIERVPRLLDLGAEAPRAPLPGIWQNADRDALASASGLRLIGVDLQQTSPAEDGLVREWTRPASGVDRHRGYAVQWFSLSALSLVLAIVFGWRTRHLWRRPAAAAVRP